MALNLATDTRTWKGMAEQLAMRPNYLPYY